MPPQQQPLTVDWTDTTMDPASDGALDAAFPQLRSARDHVRKVAAEREGGHCPCCGQDVKVYRRTVTASMALALVQIYRYYWHRPAAPPLRVAEYLAKCQIDKAILASWHGGDWAKLRYWDLIEQQAGQRPDGSNRVGLYRITPNGKAFVERKVSVPKYAFVYAQTFMGIGGNAITIDDALGTRFNLQAV